MSHCGLPKTFEMSGTALAANPGPAWNPGLHPLDAPPEQKLFRASLGRMPLTPRVKMALFVLQGYFGVMVLLVGWKLIAGI